MIKPKKKKCAGECGEFQYIWKRIAGEPYCKICASKIDKPKISKKSQRPIKKRSSKRQRQETAYKILRIKHLEANPMCKAKISSNCTLTSTDIHHMKGRLGDLLLDEKYFLAACRNCHDYIEKHPVKAKELNLSKDRLAE